MRVMGVRDCGTRAQIWWLKGFGVRKLGHTCGVRVWVGLGEMGGVQLNSGCIKNNLLFEG